MQVFHINSTSTEEVTDLVMNLIKSEAMDIKVFNEFEEDITDEIIKLKSLKIRSMIKKK